MTSIPLPKRVNIDEVVEHSFKDFHVKGFDYICLRRSPEETLKLYFFDGDISKLSEVVAPHDHRYDFETHVVTGKSENRWFDRSMDYSKGQTYNWFEYLTPLNGGDGFNFIGEEQLFESARKTFKSGDSYFMQAHELHTIKIVENETVLMLVQFEDRVAVGKPTYTFTTGDAPVLDGLYTKFTADQVIAKLKRFEERTGHTFISDLEKAA